MFESDRLPPPLKAILTAANALIFRITHVDNVRWILEHGLHCASGHRDPDFVSIGNPELIERRRQRLVGKPPGGTLADYVPFYFTPCSPMLFKIKTGHGGISQRKNPEIVILVSSLAALARHGVTFLFTDRHAYLQSAQFFVELSHLESAVDFTLLQRRDFHHDPEHPDRFERYQAEALAHRFVPAEAILGIGCYTAKVKENLEEACSAAGRRPDIVCRPEWYFP